MYNKSMPSVMRHNFAVQPSVNKPRSIIDRNSGLKTTLDADYLVPVFLDEVLPGDTHKLNSTFFARLATPQVPFMDNVFLDTFFFFVPSRLVWDNFKKFHGEQKNPSDSTDYLIPTVKPAVSSGGFGEQSLFDYFGIPPHVENIEVNALPLRAFNLIYNEWFRDENLQDSVPVNTGDGPDSVTDYVLLKRGKRHDYFTSCLPWPQKGASVDIPLGSQAPIISTASDNPLFMDYNNGAYFARQNPAVQNATVFADLTEATAATINELRQAFAIQSLLELDARSGTRYTEIVRAHFGVISPDSRLQRPEYLGGGSFQLNMNPLAQTSESSDGGKLGELAGVATVTGMSGFAKSFTEHGYIIGIANIRCDLNYQQGLDRLWSRQTRYDFYDPMLDSIGEQAVLNKEIYLQGTSDDDDVFGYQERFAEYRFKNSLITGKFRSTSTLPLDNWHLAQDFDSLPLLNDEFITSNSPFDRVLAVSGEPQFILDAYHKLQNARVMTVHSLPGKLFGRF